MIYLKSLLVGIVAAIVTAALWFVGSFAVPVFGPALLAWWTTGYGSYGGGTVMSSGSILLAALFGFALGFGWAFRRSRRFLVQR